MLKAWIRPFVDYKWCYKDLFEPEKGAKKKKERHAQLSIAKAKVKTGKIDEKCLLNRPEFTERTEHR